MKNLTPPHLRCEWGECPSVQELDDGQHLMIVGKNANHVTTREWREDRGARAGEDELTIIIDKAILAIIRDEVREDCARIADEFARPIAPGTTSGSVTQMTGENIAAAIRALKETPHE